MQRPENLWPIISTPWASCCGATILSDFGFERKSPRKTQLKQVEETLLWRIYSARNAAFLTLILNYNQKKYFNGLLEKLDFKVSAENMGREGRILYMYTCYPPRTASEFTAKYGKFLESDKKPEEKDL